MSAVIPPEEERFATNIISLSGLVRNIIAELQVKGYQTVDLAVVDFASCILQNIDKVSVIEGFIRRTHKLWDQIRTHNRDFFLENSKTIFGELNSSHVDSFKMIFSLIDEKGNNVMAVEDEEMIWSYFDSMVKISIKYVHKQRKAGEFMEEINLEQAVETWGIVLK